ncbi:MAG: phage terminase large subunit [Dehalococcoidales bacterium]|nr:phage terminase large subunit [Dehalococcoidales bacterium]
MTAATLERREVEVQYTRIFERLLNTSASEVYEIGGAGSSKSYSICQLVSYYLNQYNGLKIAVGRQTFPSLRMTMMRDLIDMWSAWGMYAKGQHDRTNHTFDYNGNHVQFFSIGVGEGGIERIKSSQWNLIICEEVTDFTREDILQLTLRLRHPKPDGWNRNRLIAACNPIDENHWVITQGQTEDRVINHSTYKDNPFLDADYTNRLEGLIKEDANFYRIYALGLPGKLENLIFKHWKETDKFPDKYRAWGYGLDFGYSHAMALVKVAINDDGVYWQQMIHQQHLTTADLIERLSHFPRGDIYADSARPDQIEELRRAGFTVFEANKDHKTGFDAVLRQPLYITSDSPQLLKEVKGYARKKDPKSGIVLEDPIKFNDDGMDAGRYGTVGMLDRFGRSTAGAQSEVRKGRIS